MILRYLPFSKIRVFLFDFGHLWSPPIYINYILTWAVEGRIRIKDSKYVYSFFTENVLYSIALASNWVRLASKVISFFCFLRSALSSSTVGGASTTFSLLFFFFSCLVVPKEERNLSDPFEKWSDRLYHVFYMV